MKIFLICTVRLGVTDMSREYVKKLEAMGHQVHFPPRDTPQVDPTGGWNICIKNMTSIFDADEVHVIYNPQSQGIHFDLGMAFVLHKKIRLINPFDWAEEKAQNKSFLNMIEYWQKEMP